MIWPGSLIGQHNSRRCWWESRSARKAKLSFSQTLQGPSWNTCRACWTTYLLQSTRKGTFHHRCLCNLWTLTFLWRRLLRHNLFCLQWNWRQVTKLLVWHVSYSGKRLSIWNGLHHILEKGKLILCHAWNRNSDSQEEPSKRIAWYYHLQQNTFRFDLHLSPLHHPHFYASSSRTLVGFSRDATSS